MRIQERAHGSRLGPHSGPTRIERTRSNPGPLLFMVIGYLLAAASVLRAHDPGLSSLDIRVDGNRVTATLSMAAADVELAAPSARDNLPAGLGEIALKGIRVSMGGEPLPAAIDRVWMDDDAHVRLRFSTSDRRNARLAVTSGIPAQLARGHRQLLTVSGGERVIAERLLDAGSAEISVEVRAMSASASGTAFGLVAAGVGGIYVWARTRLRRGEERSARSCDSQHEKAGIAAGSL